MMTTARRKQFREFVVSTPGLILVRILIAIAIVAGWEFASGTILPRLWVSSPSAIYGVLVRWISDGSLWGHLRATLVATLVGYIIGCVFGIGTGLALAFVPRAQAVIAPYLSALYSLPKIALAPLFIIFFGIGLESKIALVAITVFFPLLYNTIDGIRDIDRDLIQSVLLMGATRRELSRKVIIPGALPWVFTGMRISVRYAFTATILGELIASNVGLGFVIQSNAAYFSSAGVFAAVLILVVCSVILTEILTRFETSTTRFKEE